MLGVHKLIQSWGRPHFTGERLSQTSLFWNQDLNSALPCLSGEVACKHGNLLYEAVRGAKLVPLLESKSRP